MSRVLGTLGMGLALVLALSLTPTAEGKLPASGEVDAGPSEGQLTGREIYDRFLRNKFRSSLQHLTIVATEPGGHRQEVQLLARWKDYRDEHDKPRDGLIAKTLVRFIEPFDMRRTTYLVVARDDRSHDQFLYTRLNHRVRRILLRGVGILGTDYSIDDLMFQSIDDAEYERLPDDQVDGVPTYVVRARMRPGVDTQYRLLTTYLEKAHYVALRTLYEDGAGELRRELRSSVESIKEFDGVWIATVVTMRDVQEDTTSTMLLQHLEPNPQLDDALFNNTRLRDFAWD